MTGAVLSLYQIVGIYWIHVLLKITYPVGTLNKLNILLGVGCVILLHIYRLSESGKICSGDYLSEAEMIELQSSYLVNRGNLMWMYILIFWSALGVSVCITLVIVIMTVKALS